MIASSKELFLRLQIIKRVTCVANIVVS